MFHLDSRQGVAGPVLALCLLLRMVAEPWNVGAAENTVSGRVDAAIERWEKAVDAQQPENAREAYETIMGMGPCSIPRLIEVVETDADTRRRLFVMGCLSHGFGERARAAEPLLRKFLEKEEGILWIGAVQALNEIAPDWAQRSVPLLTRFLDHRHPKVRANAILSLRDAGSEARGVTSKLIRMMKTDESNNCRMLAADALPVIAPDSSEAVSALIETLDDPDSAMIRQLGWYGPMAKSAVPRLIQILGDEHAFTRKDAAYTLGAVGPDALAALPVLIEHLEKDEASFVRVACAASLGKIGANPQAVVPALVRACQSEDVDVVEAAAQSLGLLGTPAKLAIAQLLRVLEDESARLGKDENECARMRIAAAVALGRIGAEKESVVPVLKEHLADHDPRVQVVSAVALSQYGVTTTESLSILDTAFRNGDYNALAALSAMEAIGQQHVAMFLGMTRHEDEFERLFGIRALAVCRSVSDEMLSAIVQGLKDHDTFVRIRTARALGDMEVRAKTRIDALRDAARCDKDWAVRQAAQEAMKKIASLTEETRAK